MRGDEDMALSLDPKRTAIMAMDFQNDMLEITSNYQEKDLLGTIRSVLNAGRRQGVMII